MHLALYVCLAQEVVAHGMFGKAIWNSSRPTHDDNVDDDDDDDDDVRNAVE